MKKDLKPIWIYLICEIGLSIIIGFICGVVNKETNINTMTLIISAISFFVFIFYYKDMLIKDFKRLTKKDWLIIIGCGLVLFGVNALITEVTNVGNNDNQGTIEEIVKQYKIISLIILGFATPIIEELLFRYSFKTFIKNKYLYLVVSSLLFGIAHVLGLEGLFYAAIGLVLGLVYIKFDNNVVASSTVHIINNVISIILLML